ncbi:roadblock/LC7 domain-containing protein, partial [Streptomyces thinghirensis]|nr:roadblock/LC7 domain-containing protein [Streptomyces thinghirensis]
MPRLTASRWSQAQAGEGRGGSPPGHFIGAFWEGLKRHTGSTQAHQQSSSNEPAPRPRRTTREPQVIERRNQFDWMLQDLHDAASRASELIVVLSADSLRIARFSGDPDAADRVARGLREACRALAQRRQPGIPTS